LLSINQAPGFKQANNHAELASWQAIWCHGRIAGKQAENLAGYPVSHHKINMKWQHK
jgi:hypothetical protein